MIVTGPSFAISTSMRAPNTPRSVWIPCRSSASQKTRKRGSATSGLAAREKLGRLPLAVSAISVNWLTTRAAAAGVQHAPIEPALVVLEDPQARDAAREPLRASSSDRSSATPSSTQTPGPISPTRPPRRVTRRHAHPLDERPHVLTRRRRPSRRPGERLYSQSAVQIGIRTQPWLAGYAGTDGKPWMAKLFP